MPAVTQWTRAHHIWETLRTGFDVSSKTNSWPRYLKDLWILRSDKTVGGLLHPRTIFGAPVQHPLMPGVSPARGLYTVESVDKAVDLMRDIYATCTLSTVKPGHPQLETRINGLAATLGRLAA